MSREWIRPLPVTMAREVQGRAALEREITTAMTYAHAHGRTIGSISVADADYSALTRSIFVQMRFSIYSFVRATLLSPEAFFESIPLLKDESLPAGAFIIWTEYE